MRLALSLTALFLAGCATVTPVASLKTKTASALTRPSIRGNAVVEFKNRTVLRGHALIVAKEPAYFKIVLLGPLGHTAWAMTGNTESISIFKDAKSTTYAPGDPDLPYRFTSHELVAYLMGKIPPTSAAGSAVESYRTLRDEKGQITETVKYIGGRAVLNIKMADYRTVSERSLPFLISISDVQRSLNIRFSSIETDLVIKESLFEDKKTE